MRAIPIPPRLDERPRWRGLPIPYIALVTKNGEPDFRAIDHLKRKRVIEEELCQLCGERLGRFIFFVGGTASAEAMAYYEPPAHLDCLIYAMQVCPFIMSKMEHVPIEKLQADVQADNPEITIMRDASFTVEKCEWWVIVKATGWTIALNTDHSTLLRPAGQVRVFPPIHAQTMSAGDWDIARHALRL